MIDSDSERAERLASLLTLSYEPMFAWQLDGPIEFWNTGAERLYGFSIDEAIGRSSHTLLQTRWPIELTKLRSHLRSERYWSGELRHVCKDGREVIVDSRMQLLGDDTVLEVNRDVTAIAIYRAVFNQSGIFAGISNWAGLLFGPAPCPGFTLLVTVRLAQSSRGHPNKTGPATPGPATLRRGSLCLRISGPPLNQHKTSALLGQDQ